MRNILNTGINVQLIATTGLILSAIVTVCLPILLAKLKETTKKVDDLLLYKPGIIAYDLLLSIKDRSNNTYLDSDPNKKRCLNLLLDDGYLQPANDDIKYIFFDEAYNGLRLCDIAKLTPIAERLIELRRKT